MPPEPKTGRSPMFSRAMETAVRRGLGIAVTTTEGFYDVVDAQDEAVLVFRRGAATNHFRTYGFTEPMVVASGFTEPVMLGSPYPDLGELQRQVASLMARQEELVSLAVSLNQKIEGLIAAQLEEGGDLRELPDDEAKKEIKAYFEAHHGENLFPSDVAHALHLEYDTVSRLLGELEDDGQVARASAA